MIKFYLSTVVALTGLLAWNPTFSQDWLWEKTGGSVGVDAVTAVEIDVAESVYVAGSFTEVLQIPGQSPVQPEGGQDAFLIKYLHDGTLLWFVTLGGPGDDEIIDMKVDSDGNLYLVGNFDNTIELGSIDELPVTASSTADQDIFIAKYNTNGVLQIGFAGNLYYGDNLFFNHYSSSIDFYVQAGQVVEIIVAGYLEADADMEDYDAYLYRFEDSGVFIEGFRTLGSYLEIATGATYDNQGNIIVTGYFYDELNILNSNEYLYGNLHEVFVLKYTRGLDLLWGKSAGSNGEDAGGGVTVDAQNNIFVTGLCQNLAAFGPHVVTTNGGQDFFVTKYNPTGGVEWVETGGSDGNDYLSKIHAGSDGGLYLIGSYEHSCSFGANNSISLQSNNGSRDILLIKYTSDGDIEWHKSIGSINEDWGGDVVVGDESRVVVGGAFSNSITLSNTIASNGSADFFVGILDEDLIDTSIPEIATTDLNVFPNPATSAVQLEFPEYVTEGRLQLMDSGGRILQDEYISGIYATAEVNVENLPNGLYVLALTTGELMYRSKIVVQH